MKRNPVIPYILIMVFGIGLVIILSFKGLGDAKEVANEKANGGEKTEVAVSEPKDIYKKSCIGCHGDQYQGGAGPALKGVGGKYSKEEIMTIVTEGKGTGMPGGLVKEDEAAAMADWLADIK